MFVLKVVANYPRKNALHWMINPAHLFVGFTSGIKPQRSDDFCLASICGDSVRYL
jgi:hypothetical protein